MSPNEFQGFVGKILAILVPVMTAIAAITPRYRHMSDLQIAYEIGRRVGRYESRIDHDRHRPAQVPASDPLSTKG